MPTEQTEATTSSAPAPSQTVTAPPPVAPAPTPANAPLGDDFRKGLEELSGVPARVSEPDPSPVAKAPPSQDGRQADAPAAPSTVPHEDKASDTQPGADGKQQNDPFADIDSVLGEKPSATEPNKPAEGEQLPQTEEEVAKAINPDGKATEAERLTKLQSFYGKHAREVGAYRKAIEGLRENIGFDPATGEIDFARVVSRTGVDKAAQQLAKIGLTVIPIDKVNEQTEQPDNLDAVSDKILEGWVNELVKENITPVEKLALLREQDPDKYQRLLTRSEAVAIQQLTEKRVAKSHEHAEAKRKADSYMEQLESRPDAKQVLPIMQEVSKSIPFDKPFRGVDRVKFLHQFAMLKRFYQDAKANHGKTVKQAEAEAARKIMTQGYAPGSGGVPPLHSTGVIQGSGLSQADQEAFQKLAS